MGCTYSPAPEVERIADALIREHHLHLDVAEIEYVFRSEAGKKGSRDVLGRARLVTGLAAYLTRAYFWKQTGVAPSYGPFFVIEIARDTWERLSQKAQIALVDHELSHCFVDEDGKLLLLNHDLEEFLSVYQRHGTWRDELRLFEQTAGEQLSLFGDEAERGTAEVA